MKIFSDNKLSYLDITLQKILSEKEPPISDRSYIKIIVDVSCGGFNGRNEDVWLSRSEIERFLKDIRLFEKQRQGSIELTSLGAPSNFNDFSLGIYTSNPVGNINVKVDLLRVQYFRNGDICPLKVSVGFNVDAGDILNIMTEFEMLFKTL